MRAIVTGMIATYPVGGMVWDYGQTALGLEKLGFEVLYLEDTGLESYIAEPARYLQDSLRSLSPRLAERWHYRTPGDEVHGTISTPELADAVACADLFVNVSGGCLMRDAYMRCPRKVLIDTDPGLNHFVNFPKWDRVPGWQGTHGYRGHDHFFTYAINIGHALCNLPSMGLIWHPTCPPVVMSRWEPEPPAERWTTVMSWNPYRHYRNPIQHEGVTYGAKEQEFERIEHVPTLVKAQLEVAVDGDEVPRDRWRGLGWHVASANGVSRTAETYSQYIQSSRAEFSVAKNVYVATGCGWFSTRSVCYLAAGRPVVVQETGFSSTFPTGEGLFSFSTADEAVRAIDTVEADYQTHSDAARDIARKYFDSDRVLGDILLKVGLG